MRGWVDCADESCACCDEGLTVCFCAAYASNRMRETSVQHCRVVGQTASIEGSLTALQP